jgi:hypothetical protein
MLKFFSYWRDEASVRRGLAHGVFLLCAYAAWMRGGVHPPLQWPLAILSALLCIAVFLLPVESLRMIRSRVRQDPVFYFGICFLVLLIFQLTNSGYAPERLPRQWVPWSVERGSASEMLNWFFPTFVVLLVVRNILRRADIKVLVHLLVWNSAALACAGIIQYLFGVHKMLGIWEMPRPDFFATFAYPNHAAAWFYLHAALAAGLAHDADIKHKPRIRVAVWGACFLCCIAASFLTLSRVGAFVAFSLLLGVAVLLLRRTRAYLKGTKAINAYLALSILALVAATLFFGAGGGGLAREVTGKTLLGEQSISNDLTGRIGHIACACDMVTDYPLFGTGGWGCDGLASLYIPADELRSWLVGGRASVHCDPIQFLTEFGLVGGLCMAGVVAVLGLGVATARRSVLFYWVAGGLAAVFVHGFIDLPFRCPAILLAWCCMFAALPHLTRKHTLEDKARL